MAKVVVAVVPGADARLAAAFEVLAESPDGVARMRDLVLSLAVRGELSSDVAGAPASTTRGECEFEPASDAGSDAARLPFSVPPSWRIRRLGDLLDLFNGHAFKPSDWKPKGLPIVRIQNLNNPQALFNFCDAPFPARCAVKDGDLLISWSGTPGTSFGAFIWRRGAAVLNQHIFRAELKDPSLDVEFMRLCVNARLDEMISRAHGAVGLRHITKGNLESMAMPVPPPAEQRRIVARVDELMGWIDQFEAARNQREAARLAARDACLATLCAATNPTEVAAAWSLLATRFDALFTTTADIGLLRRAILQLAMGRRLVPRDGGPGSSRGGNLGDHVSFLNGYAFKTEWYRKTEGVRLVRNTNVSHGTLVWDEEARLAPDMVCAFERFELFEGDIVLSLDRPLISTGLKLARIQRVDLPALLLQRVACLRPLADSIDPDFLYLWMQSPPFTDAIDPGRSNGVPHIATKELARIPIDCPSREEQLRIIARVRHLMAACDSLGASLMEGYAIAAAASVAMVSCEGGA